MTKQSFSSISTLTWVSGRAHSNIPWEHLCRQSSFLDFGVRIVHMLLMSWAGEWARKNLMSRMGWDLDLEAACAVAILRDRGVEHRDIRPPNVL
jgi:hypothetical protein